VGRIRRIVLLAGAASLLALIVPAVALAGTYTWNEPGDFSVIPPGSNPEHKYGQPSWMYEVDGSSFGPESSTGTYSNANGSIVDANGMITMTAQPGHSVTLAWRNPFTSSQTVTFHSSIALTSPVCLGTLTTSANGPTTLSPGAVVTVTLMGGLLLPCQASGTVDVSATVPPPAVSLTSPANGSTITGQPTFAGGAASGFGNVGQVTVRVYNGSSASGTPVATLTAAVSGGSYSVAPNAGLPNGQFTAQTEQDNLAGDRGFSSPSTFTIHSLGPPVTLDSLGGAPLETSTPTFTGSGGTGPTDANQVSIVIYSGTNIGSSPVRQITGAIGSGGHFSVPLMQGLDDGQYTAVASQAGRGGVGFSPPVTFSIKVHPPALSLDRPASGSSVGRNSLAFSGHAGDTFGDSPVVTVFLFRGTGTSGRPVGKVHGRANGSHWVADWNRHLPLGFYTAQAQQTDDAGHTSVTAPHTFLLVPGPPLVGSKLALHPSGVVSVPVACLEPADQTCIGTVLIVTQRKFQTTPGGPSGPLEVLFVKVRIAGGTVRIVRGRAPGPAANALRRFHKVAVVVTIKLGTSAGGVINTSAKRFLKIT
jgi:hypothetical protein